MWVDDAFLHSLGGWCQRGWRVAAQNYGYANAALVYAEHALDVARRTEEEGRAAAARDLHIIEQAAAAEDELQARLAESNAALAATQAALAHLEQEATVLREEKRQRRAAHLEQNAAEKVRSLRVRGGGARVPLRARSLAAPAPSAHIAS
jgi:hypothetical protein